MLYKIVGNIGKYQLFGALHQKREVEGLKSQINLCDTGLQGDKSLGRVMEEDDLDPWGSLRGDAQRFWTWPRNVGPVQ